MQGRLRAVRFIDAKKISIPQLGCSFHAGLVVVLGVGTVWAAAR